ncbi:hypothetical protein IEO21_05932 [Rhodonia placenta]|uniref:Cytochrome P450 n=1 Tax=Rhodonia placenta TaxID=104341 RepID=A0A8H7P0Z0_9APHY|nr:hypothetical protein IEO21_05932 [Postia placenta]
MNSSLHVAACASAALFAISLAVFLRWLKADSHLRLPPGPNRVPLLGNVHQLPMQSQEKKFTKWGAEYVGDIVFAKFFRTPTLVINSLQAAHDLLGKKSSIYSYRPDFVLLSELMGWDCVVTHMTYGDRFRKHRRWILDAFQDKHSLESYRPLQRREAYILLSGLIQNPELFRSHIKRFAAAMIMQIAYGHSVTSLDDKFVHLAERAGKETVEYGNAGVMLVDFFPLLKHIPLWMPGSGFKRRAFEIRDVVRKMLDTPYEMVKDAMKSGTASPCLTATLLEEVLSERAPTREDEDDIKGTAGVLYGGKSNRTSAVLSTFVLAMVLYPEVYKKAQAEVDRVVGQDRLPDFEDRESLPYLECVVKEVYRWNCPVPLGIPHKLISNDQYQGFDIPGGSMVIPNIWGMTRNDSFYPEPEMFRPERFEQMDRYTAEARDPRNMVFGFGRRVCPGQDFADTSVWIAVANMVATLDIAVATDEAGKQSPPTGSFVPGFVSHPEEFTCRITPRSEQVKTVVFETSANIVL